MAQKVLVAPPQQLVVAGGRCRCMPAWKSRSAVFVEIHPPTNPNPALPPQPHSSLAGVGRIGSRIARASTIPAPAPTHDEPPPRRSLLAGPARLRNSSRVPAPNGASRCLLVSKGCAVSGPSGRFSLSVRSSITKFPVGESGGIGGRFARPPFPLGVGKHAVISPACGAPRTSPLLTTLSLLTTCS